MAEHEIPRTIEQFDAMVDGIEANPDYQRPAAFALGVATVEDDEIIDVKFTRRNYESGHGTAAVLASVLNQEETGLQTGQYPLGRIQAADALDLLRPLPYADPEKGNIDTLSGLRNISRALYSPAATSSDRSRNPQVPVVSVVSDWEDAPESVGDTYLRLYALSERHRTPNTVNLDGAFGRLKNLVISESQGSFSVERWNEIQEQLVLNGLSTAVRVLDKFPRMLDHVVPSGVRVADPSRVRLGAHLGEGTTVMHEGFSNFNAGTLGASMVEGRISQGVVVGEGTDVGGGASTQGTLSGGGKEKVSIGEGCLLEANSGIGISLGDDCRVEAGLYVKSTTPVRLPDGNVVKAAVLSGESNMMFRRNSQDGAIELVPNKGGEWGGLNTELHDN